MNTRRKNLTFRISSLLLLLAVVLVLSSMLVSSVQAEGTLFPSQPVEMKPGYGADGSGLHFAVPEGLPGNDCVINPVSMTRGLKTVTVTKMVPGTIIEIPAHVLFDFDKSFLRPEGENLLQHTVKAKLDEFGVTEIDVYGHTDAKGTNEYNYALGLRRAQSVADFLTSVGFPTEGVSVYSSGEETPIAPNVNEDGSDNPEGRQKNRRVEIVVKNVADQEVSEEKEVVYNRNPQIFHRLSQNNRVICNGGPEHGYNLGFMYFRLGR